MTDTPFTTGKCLCGAVRFTIKSAPVMSAQCHCLDCQHASGTGHMSIAFFKQGDVELTGQTASFASTAESGSKVSRSFCPTCGSRLYSENSSRPGVMGFAVGSLDDNSWFKPDRVVYAKDKPAWDVSSTDVPRYDRMPPKA